MGTQNVTQCLFINHHKDDLNNIHKLRGHFLAL